MRKRLCDSWIAMAPHPEPQCGLTDYVTPDCAHGKNVRHSVADALRCGILPAVRAERRMSRMQLARELHVHYNTIARWERGEMTPLSGPTLLVIEHWLLGS